MITLTYSDLINSFADVTTLLGIELKIPSAKKLKQIFIDLRENIGIYNQLQLALVAKYEGKVNEKGTHYEFPEAHHDGAQLELAELDKQKINMNGEKFDENELQRYDADQKKYMPVNIPSKILVSAHYLFNF